MFVHGTERGVEGGFEVQFADYGREKEGLVCAIQTRSDSLFLLPAHSTLGAGSK
jgi:hypothetical protein